MYKTIAIFIFVLIYSSLIGFDDTYVFTIKRDSKISSDKEQGVIEIGIDNTSVCDGKLTTITGYSINDGGILLSGWVISNDPGAVEIFAQAENGSIVNIQTELKSIKTLDNGRSEARWKIWVPLPNFGLNKVYVLPKPAGFNPNSEEIKSKAMLDINVYKLGTENPRSGYLAKSSAWFQWKAYDKRNKEVASGECKPIVKYDRETMIFDCSFSAPVGSKIKTFWPDGKVNNDIEAASFKWKDERIEAFKDNVIIGDGNFIFRLKRKYDGRKFVKFLGNMASPGFKNYTIQIKPGKDYKVDSGYYTLIKSEKFKGPDNGVADLCQYAISDDLLCGLYSYRVLLSDTKLGFQDKIIDLGTMGFGHGCYEDHGDTNYETVTSDPYGQFSIIVPANWYTGKKLVNIYPKTEEKDFETKMQKEFNTYGEIYSPIYSVISCYDADINTKTSAEKNLKLRYYYNISEIQDVQLNKFFGLNPDEKDYKDLITKARENYYNSLYIFRNSINAQGKEVNEMLETKAESMNDLLFLTAETKQIEGKYFVMTKFEEPVMLMGESAKRETNKKIDELFKKFKQTIDIQEKINIVSQIFRTPGKFDYGIEQYIDIYGDSVSTESIERLKELCEFMFSLEDAATNETNPDKKYTAFLSIFQLRKIIGRICSSEYINSEFVKFCTDNNTYKISLNSLFEFMGETPNGFIDLNNDGIYEEVYGRFPSYLIGESAGKISAVELVRPFEKEEILKYYGSEGNKSILIKNCGGNGEGGCNVELIGYLNNKLIKKFTVENEEGLAGAYLTSEEFNDGEKLVALEKIEYKGHRFPMIYKWNGDTFDDVTLKYKDAALKLFEAEVMKYKENKRKSKLSEYKNFFYKKSPEYDKFWEDKLKPIVIKYGIYEEVNNK